MVSCGHQLDADWLLGSSAGAPIGGASTAATILQSVFAGEEIEEPKEINHDHRLDLQGRGMRLSIRRCQDIRSCNRHAVPSYHDFSNFDEEEHLDGCPVKWLYQRQTEQPMAPVRELCVRKMSLKNRRKRKKKTDESRIEKFETEKVDYSEEVRSNVPNLRNFLPPRPLAGLRPWFYVLLAPRSAPQHSTSTLPRQPDARGSISVRSLSLPQVAPLRAPSTPRASQASRWAGPQAPQRSLQAPPALDISLRGGQLAIAEDQLHRLKKLFNYLESSSRKDEGKKHRRQHDQRKRREQDEIYVICNRVQFFERPGKPMR